MNYRENSRTDFSEWKMEFRNGFEKRKEGWMDEQMTVQEHKVLILISTGNEMTFQCSLCPKWGEY